MPPPPIVGSMTLTEGSGIGWPKRVLEENVQDSVKKRTFGRGKLGFRHYKGDIIFMASPFPVFVAIPIVRFQVSGMFWG